MQRILDWAIESKDVDSQYVLMMGNSGGGMVTLFTAACDERIKVAVPSCSFAPTISESGYIFHCDCNMVPGLIQLGGLPGVASLIAPRHLLAVNGRTLRILTVSDQASNLLALLPRHTKPSTTAATGSPIASPLSCRCDFNLAIA